MNCPEMHYECDSLCSYRRGDTCTQSGLEIYDLMTHAELIIELKKYVKPEPIPTSDEIHRLKVLINDLENRLNVHIDNSKIMAKKKKSKYD